MLRRPIAGVLLLCILAACTSWHVEKEVGPLQLISTKHPRAVRQPPAPWTRPRRARRAALPPGGGGGETCTPSAAKRRAPANPARTLAPAPRKKRPGGALPPPPQTRISTEQRS